VLSIRRLTTIAAVTAALFAVPAVAHADGPTRIPVNAPGATAVDSASQQSVPAAPTWPVNPQVIDKAPPAQASDDGVDWTTMAFGVGAALVLAAASATQLRRVKARRRRAAGAAT
jgi:hypothetical protein